MNKLVVCTIFLFSIAFTGCNDKTKIERIAVTDISIEIELFALKIGKSHTLSASVTPINATNPNIVWLSDNETIATIDPVSGIVTGCGLGETSIRAISTEYSIESHCKIVVLPTDPYIVGDLYPNSTNPEGIVFWIDPTNPIKGKIVSIEETRTKWGRNDTSTNALNMNNGQANTSTIELLEDWQFNYPAFAWCIAKGDGWFLPALNELLELYENKELLNKIIQQNGDIPFSTGDYWSSTENSNNAKSTALTVIFRTANYNEGWASKDGECSVRAIKTF